MASPPVPGAAGTMVLKPGIISSNPNPDLCIVWSKDLKRAEGHKNVFFLCCGSNCCLKCGAGDGKACPKCGTLFNETVADDVRVLKKHAKKGRAWAQYLIGSGFEHGTHMMQSHYEAVRWYRKSAREGHPVANLNLAYYYLVGIGGCGKDLAIAEDYLNRAIAIDVCVRGLYERRMHDISDEYRKEGNVKEAKRILVPLAGNDVALSRLAGICVAEEDWTSAEEYFTACAMKGDVVSACNAAIIIWDIPFLVAKASVWLKYTKANLHLAPLSSSKMVAIRDIVFERHGRLCKLRRFCATCDTPLDRSTRKLCSGCRTFCYCSTECQKLHWDRKEVGHRADCKAAQALVKALKDVPACDSIRQVI